MNRIGLIGGVSWHSTIDYYRYINEMVAARLGLNHSANLIINSVDFHWYLENNRKADHRANMVKLKEVCEELEKLDVATILICSNTGYVMAEELQELVRTPILHIADATGKEIAARGLNCVGILGTKFVMELDFYHKRLANFGVKAILPSDSDREYVNNSIFDEFAEGKFFESTRVEYQRICNDLVARGAQGIILGCTEIPILIKPEHVSVPTFDTTYLHAKAAVEVMFEDEMAVSAS